MELNATLAVSVVICTRNPRPEVFERALCSLAAQTLPRDRWECLVVDNASDRPVAESARRFLPEARAVVEPAIGLTPARLRGIRESQGKLIIFVDDDNLLAADYLEQAIRIADHFPQMGAFGGRITSEFESPPPGWLRPFWSHLAIIDFDSDRWSNNPADHSLIPCGAGLCIRREAALAYAGGVAGDPRRLDLDRAGHTTLSCGDTDMVLTAVDAGWGMGRFRALHLTHVIPELRLQFGYQKQLAADIGFSYGRLLNIRGEASRGRRWIAAYKTLLAVAGVTHRGKSRALDAAFHHGVWRGMR